MAKKSKAEQEKMWRWQLARGRIYGGLDDGAENIPPSIYRLAGEFPPNEKTDIEWLCRRIGRISEAISQIYAVLDIHERLTVNDASIIKARVEALASKIEKRDGEIKAERKAKRDRKLQVNR